MSKLLCVLILFIGMIPASSFANDRFIAYCKNGMDYWQKSFIQKVYGTSWDCKKFDEKISQAKSFEEFLPLISDDNIIHDWKRIPLPRDVKFGDPGPSNYGFLKHLFPNVDAFIGFDNLEHISLVDRDYARPCEIVAKFPHLKTMTLPSDLFYSEGVDDCLADAGLDGVFLLGVMEIVTIPHRQVIPVFKSRTAVLGIEKWQGLVSTLSLFPKLKYLDYFQVVGKEGLELLSKTFTLTHFSMRDANFDGFNDFSSLKELRHLILRDYQRSTPENKITDISALRTLTMLKEIVITDNKIKDISVLKSLKHLERIDLQGNEIESIPDLSHLTKLRYLDLNDNYISTLDSFTASASLTDLNLALNRLSDFSSLSRASNLRALNISGNSLQEKLILPSLPKLKLLSIDGSDGIERGSFGSTTRSMLKSALSSEAFSQLGIMEVNLWNKEESCATRKTFDEFELPELPELEVLSLKNQKLKVVPDLSSFSQLRFLNLSGNNFPVDLEVESVPSLKVLHLSNYNQVVEPRILTTGTLVRIRYEYITPSLRCFFGPQKN